MNIFIKLMISVCFPAKNEGKFIERSVKAAKKTPNVMEVIVIDGGSMDDTVKKALKAGAHVVYQSDLKYPGKGIAMRDGVYYARGSIIVFLDADIKNLDSSMILSLTKPIINREADFVKGAFGRKAGRVTELVAKPLIKMFYPELSSFNQPLGGEIAGLKNVFLSVNFEGDWGVDVGLLIDIYKKGFKIVEVDIGFKDHDMKPLHLLTDMAYDVAKAILTRAMMDGKIDRIGYEKHIEAIPRGIGESS
jgi:glycosyltransferase involved in cell wall biosynthesis